MDCHCIHAGDERDGQHTYRSSDTSYAIYTTKGELIAPGNTALWNTSNVPLDTAIGYNQDGVSSGGLAYTGTAPNGSTYDPLGESEVNYGLASQTNSTWILDGYYAFPGPGNIYAISSPITNDDNGDPIIGAPEPPCLALLGVSMIGLGGAF